MGISRIQPWLLAVIALGIPLSSLGAQYPGNTWLQVGPVAFLLPFAVIALRRWPLSDAAALSLGGFMLLHLFAARWSYSSVPYEDWFAALGMGGIGETFGFKRNMFDRLVHFAFGMVAVIPAVELSMRYGRLGRGQGLTFAALLVLAVGGLYEIFEWTLTMLLSPDDAGAYNGEQGDIFDSQKDMTIAALGMLLALPFAACRALPVDPERR